MNSIVQRGSAANPADSAPTRAVGIDAGRIVMAFLVVAVHALPVGGAAGFAIVGMLCRCAVPFFFMAAGYFLKVPRRFTATLLLKPLIRLVPIYGFWMLVYYGVAAATGVVPVRLGLRDLLSGGTAFHLWYLPALGIAMVLVPAGILVAGPRATGIVCAVLAGEAIAFGTYHDLLGLPGSAQRGGLLIAPLFVFAGYAVARLEPARSVVLGAGLAALGFATLFGEELAISHRLGVTLASHDFAFGTVAYGAGAFLLARALAPGRNVSRLATLGRYALGVYVAHVLFVWGLSALSGKITPVGLIWRTPTAFGCAMVLTALLRQLPYLRRVVA